MSDNPYAAPASSPPATQTRGSRRIILLSLTLIVIGLIMGGYATTIPVYTDPKAPERLSVELEQKPREVRFGEWYAQLRAYETPHKRLSDTGRGLVAAGAGLLLAGGFWRLYHLRSGMRTAGTVLSLWLALWAIRIPLSFWYYEIRQERFDYPVWGDSIAIPIGSECVAWIAGAVVSTLVLGALLFRHPLPIRIRLVRPGTAWSWGRTIFLWAWLALLGVCIAEGLTGGDEGMILPPLVAAVILLAFLSAPEVRFIKKESQDGISTSPAGA